jgi:hypothetical protein
MTTTSIDELAGILRPQVTWEVHDLIENLHPSDLTMCELVGMLAILRAANERTLGVPPPAQLTLLRPKPARNRKRPVHV